MFLFFSILNLSLQRIQYCIFEIRTMGASNPSPSSLANYHLDKHHRHFSVLTKQNNPSEKYILKTYNTSSLDDHRIKYQQFKQYQQKLKDTQEILKLVEVLQDRIDNFCTTTCKIHLIYQYSPISIHSEIAERRRNQRRLAKAHAHSHQSLYFSYEDICNILYSCLSALWIVKESLSGALDDEFKRFGTMFLTTKDIVIIQEGAIRVMDPHLVGYYSRYNLSQNVNYSPEKLSDFYRADDEKSAIYQLGIMMLEICLLTEIKNTIEGVYSEEVVIRSLEEAKKVYSQAIEQIVGISVFDLIASMVKTDRNQRFDLQQTISYAEEMYEQQQSISQLSLQHRINCSENKIDLKRTNHSSSAKQTSPILRHSNQKHRLGTMSPKISNFTIYQQQNQEQSSMLQSLQVQNPVNKPNCFNSSVGNAGIFKQITLNDSYNYNWNQGPPKMQDEEQLFTDPELMKTIRRELSEIERRKQEKMKRSMLDCSSVLERKDRHFYLDEQQYSNISNRVYLVE